jgi:hypothetical protein
VRGKTIAQLKELFGKPDETELPEQFARPGVVNLIAKKLVYIGKFIDPDSEKPYRVVKVWIDYEDKAYNVEIP